MSTIQLKKYPFTKIIASISGGPDSMALLDLLRKDNYEIIVAHVNYQTRKDSLKEEQLVRDYCQKYNILLEISKFDKKYKRGNFQDIARQFRIDFIHELSYKYNVNSVALAHHKDDHIETYFLQKRRGGKVNIYGLPEVRKFNHLLIYRPLLNYYKKDLLHYNKVNSIPYGIDKSNLTPIYQRNMIRQSLSFLSVLQKDDIVKSIERENNNFRYSISYYNLIDFYTQNKYFFIEEYSSLILTEREDFLNLILLGFLKHYLSKKFFLEIDKALHSLKSHIKLNLNSTFCLYKSYDHVSIIRSQDFIEYFCEFHLDSDQISTPYFNINYSCGSDQIDIPINQFPLTIQPYTKDDYLIINQHHKQVKRFMIDKKISIIERKKIPIIKNWQKEIIYIPNLYKKIWKEIEKDDKITVFYDKIQ